MLTGAEMYQVFTVVIGLGMGVYMMLHENSLRRRVGHDCSAFQMIKAFVFYSIIFACIWPAAFIVMLVIANIEGYKRFKVLRRG